MDVFAHWREQEWQSTMQRLAAENVKLRRASYASHLVALAVWTGVLWIMAYRIGMFIAERIQL